MNYSPWGRKESDTTEQLIHTHLLTLSLSSDFQMCYHRPSAHAVASFHRSHGLSLSSELSLYVTSKRKFVMPTIPPPTLMSGPPILHL